MTAAFRSRTFTLLLLAAVLALAGPRHQAAAAGQSGGADRDLAGAIDMHVHTIPDSEPWRIDSVEAARQARARGMRGLVLKSHWEPTATIAYLVRQQVPGVEVFGGIDLSRAVGGINPAAVEEMTRITGGFGRVVWMPTLDAENVLRASGTGDPFVRISQNHELLPEVKDVIAVIARHGLVLATGHSSAEEVLLLVREGHRQGVQHMIVTHAMSRFPHMSIPQMQEAAREGALLELVYVHTLTIPELRRTANFTVAEAAKAIREVGAASMVLATDMGQVGIPLPTDGLARFAADLRKEGIGDSDLDRMMKENPARLLGLPARSR
jgi:hypothetical protein